ncbi:MAG: hypothetical protein IKU61_02110 [Clostridia bacterium]|nr:hypothetical protein [Clostridia bacterium]
MKIKEVTLLYAIGAIGYMFIEIVWRGSTHWTMGILGGMSILMIYFVEQSFSFSVLLKALLSAAFVTATELVAGLILNDLMGLSVWDYSDMRYNIAGQISLVYSFLWYFLCIPVHILCRIIKHHIFDVFSPCDTLK